MPTHCREQGQPEGARTGSPRSGREARDRLSVGPRSAVRCGGQSLSNHATGVIFFGFFFVRMKKEPRPPVREPAVNHAAEGRTKSNRTQILNAEPAPVVGPYLIYGQPRSGRQRSETGQGMFVAVFSDNVFVFMETEELVAYLH